MDELRVTERTLQLMEESRIFTKANGPECGMRWKVDDNINVRGDIRIEPFVSFFNGNTLCSMGSYSYSCCPVGELWTIGRYSGIAKGNALFGTRHPYEWFTNSSIAYDMREYRCTAPIKEKENCTFIQVKNSDELPKINIGNDVWIGEDCRFKRGIKIGDGAVIAARSVVTHDVEPYSIVGGVPARKIKMRFEDKIIETLLRIQWWEYNFVDFDNLCADVGIEKFIDYMEEKITMGKINKYRPKVCLGTEILATK